jgi:hypothetical protein
VFTCPPPGPVRLDDMKIPLTLLGGLVAYFIWASSFPHLTSNVVEAFGR